MNQGGLKNVVTEPTRLENKRERRRGAAGRAAALRRAPSDSDCSGETASLSADSGDRAPRPPPQPPRSAKNRGRRRGSEWEVLEGLKDGQRFEKRPDVFNGYLHKKRKWPLKGWHKRFFVVDGGILVYARSPTDVARGRLHGSVDVGLSVISAKARRRRIDIDADEFIYHLRAKTPDVFRTWLNVLKAHRLYRQHLLTFGARESVPKIHAPLDDLPPTDNSSRTGTSHDTLGSSTYSSSDDFPFPSDREHPSDEVCDDSFCFCHSSFYPSPDISLPRSPLPRHYLEPKLYDEPKVYDVHLNEKLFNNHRSLCSMNCVARFTQEDLKRRKSPDISLGSTDAEKQIHSTDLDINSVRTFETVLEDEHKISQETSPVRYSGWNLGEGKRPLFLDTKVGPTTAYFFFTRNKSRCMSPNSPMKRSKKSTNLVKYRNFIEEPTLKRPLSKCMLLGKYKMKVSKKSDPEKSADRGVTCDAVEKESNEVQVTIIDSKSLQDAMTTSDFDNITDKLMISIFQNTKNTRATEAKYYIRQVIKDLYDAKFHEVHPVKALFRSLLEYWLKNTNVEPVKHAMKRSRSIARQSNRFFTRDKNLSSVYISNVTKQTQFHGLSEMLVQYKKKPKMSQDEKKAPPPKCPSPRRDTESYEKERRIQELERLLKNTVYMCETTRSKERDIKITKTLMGNLGKLSRKSEFDESAEFKNDNSNSSTEKIQDTLNHLISETAIPADVAKELLGAYLDVLLKDDARSLTSTSSQSSEHSGGPKASKELSCEVQTEAIVKRVSKSVSTLKPADPKKEKSTEVMKPVDPGQLYLKEILDKITTIFSRVRKLDEKCRNNEKSSGDIKPSNFKKEESKDELGRSVKEYPGKNLIYENFDENSVVIGLSKYDLEHISMFSDPAIQGIMSITIKLKEKPTIGESKLAHLSLQFAESQNLKKQVKRECPMKENWLEYMQPANTNSNEIFRKKVKVAENAFIDFPQELDLKPYTSSSDATSKAYKVVHESEHSIDLSFKSSASIVKDTNAKQSFENEGTQSCYIMSFKKDSLATKFQSKKKVRLKDCNGVCLDANVLPPTKQAELSVFENPTPRVIDEKFILLLLENLTLLSKNIPSLHKEINNLFLKLRKKHEKILKSCSNMQGLSLLGKIYNEESVARVSRDAMTQWDVCGTPAVTSNVTHETAVNTATSNVKEKLQLNVRDANISAIDLKLMMNSQVQTMSNSEELILKFQRERPLGDTSLSIARSDSAYSIKAEMERTAKRTTSNSKLQFKKICVLSPTLASMIDVDAHNILIHPQILKEHAIKKKKHSSRLKQDLIKEIALLSPSFKVSAQSQTDRKLLRFVTEQAIEKDYKMYQLYQSYNVTMASSLTDSNVEINPSDEMKTLYRCSSDPSCSG